MYILGINGGVRAGYQDVSTVLVRDGEVVFALAEERLNRKKHSAGQLPFLSVKAALDHEGITIQDIDCIATHGSTWGEQYEAVVREFFTYNFGYCPAIERVHHHVAHAASAFYGSGFEKSMILTIDGSGDGICLQKALGHGDKIEVKEQIERTNSLGIFYSIFTQFCGFTRDADEYKLMGLAPYGDPDKVDLEDVIKIKPEGYVFNQEYIKKLVPGAPQPNKQQAGYSEKLISMLGQPRQPFQPISQHYKNIAAATQDRLNQALVQVVKQFHKETGLRKLCLAGGVALNCEANRHLMNLDCIDEIFVQPASSDDGISLGAAWYVSAERGARPVPCKNYYLGKAYTNDEVKRDLDLFQLSYKTIDNVAETAARLVSQNKVVAWFQGREEFGPRALGNRSILANPLDSEMKARINQKIKFRESFRPFCPSVLEENLQDYFIGKQSMAPHMTINYETKHGDSIPSVNHVNNTARIQTVNNSQNPLYYSYLKEVREQIGMPISINTSFNRKGEPIVHSPKDAISSYFGSGIDALIIGNFLLEK